MSFCSRFAYLVRQVDLIGKSVGRVCLSEADTLGIPVVLLVIEGGHDAIDDVSKSVEHNTPVVLCEGTGRAADLLAYAHTHMITNKKLALLKTLANISNFLVLKQ